MTPEQVHEIVEIGYTLPPSDVAKLVLAAAAGLESVRLLRADSGGALYHACSTILAVAASTPLAEIGGVLQGASSVSRRYRNRLDLVWTGPDIPGSVSRLTSSVVADLVDEANFEIYLLSYAMHSEPTLKAALERSIGRGVLVHLLYERVEDNPNFKTWTTSPFSGLNVRRLCWPIGNRPPGASLHAKALVIDRRTVLIGSANITDMAMMKNLEIGIVVRDGTVASEIVESIESLIAQGVLELCT